MHDLKVRKTPLQRLGPPHRVLVLAHKMKIIEQLEAGQTLGDVRRALGLTSSVSYPNFAKIVARLVWTRPAPLSPVQPRSGEPEGLRGLSRRARSANPASDQRIGVQSFQPVPPAVPFNEL